MKPFQKITEASRTTGLSQYYLRNGCKDGTIPHVKSGTVYLAYGLANEYTASGGDKLEEIYG